MRFFGWFRRQPEQNEARFSSSRRWTWLAGRRVLTNTPYVMPKDKVEGDRLDLQHHLLKLAAGSNFLAAIQQPRAILDVACGTGVWGREMAQQFPSARVVGFDIDRTPLERSIEVLGPRGQFPANFRFQQADALEPFPYATGEFDYTHARFIAPFVPTAKWPHVIAEMVRVTSPGGPIELAEGESLPVSESPAFATIIRAFEEFALARGLDIHAASKVAGYLQQAGVVNIEEQRVILSLDSTAARWQRLFLADMLAVVTNVGPVLIRQGYFTEERYAALLSKAEQELPHVGVNLPVRFVFGQKR